LTFFSTARQRRAATGIASDGRQSSWGGIRDDVLTFLHSGEPEVEALLEGLVALRLVA
jgi:hypothetical protein